MSLVTIGTNGRVYERAFDHEEAQRLHAEGWTYAQIAEHYGVSSPAVGRVCDPKTRRRMDEAAKAHIERQRQPCLGGCGALVWMHMKNAGRTGLCPSCFAERLAAPNVRENELRCTKCGEWKSDDEFGREKRNTRRGRRAWCRACDSAARRAHRHKNKAQERESDYKRKGIGMAKFTVMHQDDEGRWEERGEVEAYSRIAAIERVADEGGSWVAVGRGQMKPLDVQPAMAFKVVTEDLRRSPEPSVA